MNYKKNIVLSFCFLFFMQIFTAEKKVIYVLNYPRPAKDLSAGVWGKIGKLIEPHGYILKSVRLAHQIKEDCYRAIFENTSHYDKPYLKAGLKEKAVLFLWEPIVVRPHEYTQDFHNLFYKIYTFCDDLVDNEKYFKFHYPMDDLKVAESEVPFEEKKLCAMINADKDSSHSHSLYAERRKVICFFERYHCKDFDLYGYKWGKRGYRNYRGAVDSKIECLKKYRFCFAYENSLGISGYITEKIFDAMFAGVVPIYLGADNVTDYIPKKCFIDRRDFESDEQLYQFIKNMSQEEHECYLKNIRDYLESGQRQLFSWDDLMKKLLEAIEPGYDFRFC